MNLVPPGQLALQRLAKHALPPLHAPAADPVEPSVVATVRDRFQPAKGRDFSHGAALSAMFGHWVDPQT